MSIENENQVVDAFTYVEKDYIMKVDWNSWTQSSFDVKLKNEWLSRENLFRYKLDIPEAKKLDGGFGFFAQLNINRAVNRRPPEDITSIHQPFSHDNFNFTKANRGEFLFSLVKEGNVITEIERSYFLINISPLERCHTLLIPSLRKCLNQVITEESLHFAINTILLSGSPEMRVGFNSLCAYASVNHLHFHAYYLDMPMTLETIEVEHLIGRCHVLKNYPSKGYVFELTSISDIAVIVKDVYKLTSFLAHENIAHNLCMTRGLQFKRVGCEDTSERDCIRIFIWARTSSYGAKGFEAFTPALCELFGHLVVKTKEAYDSLDGSSVAKILNSLTDEPYARTKDRVKDMFSK